MTPDWLKEAQRYAAETNCTAKELLTYMERWADVRTAEYLRAAIPASDATLLEYSDWLFEPPVSNETVIFSDADVSAWFERLWKQYPRKTAKQAAAKAAKRHGKSASARKAIEDGLRRQLPALKAADPQFVPHFSTWLNGERWKDELARCAATPAKGGGGTVVPIRPAMPKYVPPPVPSEEAAGV